MPTNMDQCKNLDSRAVLMESSILFRKEYYRSPSEERQGYGNNLNLLSTLHPKTAFGHFLTEYVLTEQCNSPSFHFDRPS